MANFIAIPVSIAEIVLRKELIMNCSHKWQRIEKYMELNHPTWRKFHHLSYNHLICLIFNRITLFSLQNHHCCSAIKHENTIFLVIRNTWNIVWKYLIWIKTHWTVTQSFDLFNIEVNHIQFFFQICYCGLALAKISSFRIIYNMKTRFQC